MGEGEPDYTSPGTLAGLLEPGLNFYAVTFTDIVRSTDHRAQLGDTRADANHADVDGITREAMGLFRGAVVKSLGDGLMAVFRAPTDALLAGLEVQRQLARRNRTATTGPARGGPSRRFREAPNGSGRIRTTATTPNFRRP